MDCIYLLSILWRKYQVSCEDYCIIDMVAQLLKFAQEEDRKNNHYCTLVRILLSAQLPDGSDALMVAVQVKFANSWCWISE